MNVLSQELIQAALLILRTLIKEESGFLSDEVSGVAKVAESALEAAFDSNTPKEQKLIYWQTAKDSVRAAYQKFKDEAGELPETLASSLFPILLSLLGIGFK